MIVLLVLIIALLSSQASAKCGKWVIRDNTDYLEDPLFDDAVKSSIGASDSRNADAQANDGNETNEINESANVAKPDAQENDDAAPDLSGSWQVSLDKVADSSLKLILIQSGDRLQGYGSLNENCVEIPATAMGSISEDSDAVNLDFKLVKDGTLNKEDRQYKLNFALINDSLSGSYELYAGDELAGEGNATAIKS
jgi:hypothetical protein